MARSSKLDLLTKFIHRLIIDNEQEALVAFTQLRRFCERHKITLASMRLIDASDNRQALVDSYMVILDRLREKLIDERVVELQQQLTDKERIIARLQRRSIRAPSPLRHDRKKNTFQKTL